MLKFASRLFICVFVMANVLTAAPASEVKTLSGASYDGVVTRLTADAAQLKLKDGATKEIPLAEVLSIELSAPPNEAAPPAGQAIHRVRLIDGSQLLAEQVTFNGSQVALKLRGGQAASLDLAGVASILLDAHDPKNLAEFQAALPRTQKGDVVCLVSRQDPKAINTFEGVIGIADGQGQTLRFTPDGGEPVQLAISRLRSLAFARSGTKPEAKLGKLIDRHQNQFALSHVEMNMNGVKIETPTGLRLDLPLADAIRIDLSQGKLVYVSDLEPTYLDTEHVVYVPPANLKYGRDRTLRGTPISVGRKQYAKGLSLHAKTVLEYEVAGYNFFRCTLGLDDSVSRVGAAAVRIEGDGKELFSQAVGLSDAKPHEVELKIAGVKRLRLIVDYGDDLDLGDHVDFADARIMK